MAPALIDLSESRRSLWAIERRDRAGFCTWDEHGTKEEAGGPPTVYLLLWTTETKAERYNLEELRDTGRPFRIQRPYVLPFLRKMLEEAKIEWVWLDRLPTAAVETQTGVHGFARTRDLIAYLQGGGRIAGQRRS